MAPTDPTPSAKPRLVSMEQASAYASPWSRGLRFKTLLWMIGWTLLCRWTPKYFWRWRILVLKCFGVRITGKPFIASSAIIKFPWNLTLEDRACLGPKAEVYNLAPITLKTRCTISAECYLCAGTHGFSKPNLPLVIGEIIIGEDAFLGVRVFVMPGLHIGAGAVIGAMSVVTRDIPPWTIAAGNPCKVIKPRQFEHPKT